MAVLVICGQPHARERDRDDPVRLPVNMTVSLKADRGITSQNYACRL